MKANYATTLNIEEQQRRTDMVASARDMILHEMPVEAKDDSSLMLPYDDFFLQISFSSLHPLMMLHLVKTINRQPTKRDFEHVNKLNIQSVLGGHALDPAMGCYIFRTTQWLDTELKRDRFMEILLRSHDEALRGYAELFA